MRRIALLLLCLVLVPFVGAFSLVRSSSKLAEMYTRASGRVLPDRLMTTRYSGTPLLSFMISGHKWTSEVTRVDAPALYVMAVLPSDSAAGNTSRSGGGPGRFSFRDRWRARWMEGGAARETMVEIAADYDAIRGRAVVAGHEFEISRGNLFVVRFGANGRSTVSQIARTAGPRSYNCTEAVIAAYMEALPDVPELRKYHGWDDPKADPPCPSRL